VLAMVGGFVFQGHVDPTPSSRPEALSLHFAPVQYPRGGVGLAAIGTF
jgi:hypothetical protein